jgi:hypothetical protein
MQMEKQSSIAIPPRRESLRMMVGCGLLNKLPVTAGAEVYNNKIIGRVRHGDER